jgi:hypothetical protein
LSTSTANGNGSIPTTAADWTRANISYSHPFSHREPRRTHNRFYAPWVQACGELNLESADRVA